MTPWIILWAHLHRLNTESVAATLMNLWLSRRRENVSHKYLSPHGSKQVYAWCNRLVRSERFKLRYYWLQWCGDFEHEEVGWRLGSLFSATSLLLHLNPVTLSIETVHSYDVTYTNSDRLYFHSDSLNVVLIIYCLSLYVDDYTNVLGDLCMCNEVKMYYFGCIYLMKCNHILIWLCLSFLSCIY